MTSTDPMTSTPDLQGEIMIERVARAIYTHSASHGFTWETTAPAIRQNCRGEARAAIEAMREPTKAMVDDAWSNSPGEDGPMVLRIAWGNMIDAALQLDTEPPPSAGEGET